MNPRNIIQEENPEQVATIPEPMLEKSPVEEYRPSNKDALKEWEINIRFLDRGCLVNVGCRSIAFENVQDAMAEINYYVNNPYVAQQKWRKLLD